jgi:arylsulfatase A-like enzyme
MDVGARNGGGTAAPTPALEPRGAVDRLLFIGLLAGLAVRVWILVAAPLRTSRPALWLAAGTAEDVAFLAALGLVALAASRTRIGARAAGAALALLVPLVSLAHFLWAEGTIYFGHPPRREDFEQALDRRLLTQSIDRSGALRLALVCVFLAGGTAWAFARGRKRGVLRAGPLAAACAAGVAVSAATFAVPLRALARHPATAIAVLLRQPRPKRLGGTFSVPSPERDVLSVRALAPARPAREFVSQRFPLAYRAPARVSTLPPGLRPNLVFVVMEGVRAHEIGAYGSPVTGITPNLDRLAAQGIRVERVWSPGCVSPEGEVAIWYGLLAIPHGLLMNAPKTPLVGLPELLRDAGWRSLLWIHNSDQTFYNEDLFYLPRGFRMIDGRDFDRGDPETNWGKSDRALARRAVDAMDRLEEPFAAMVLTISNHHPFQVPPDATSKLSVALPERRGFVSMPGLPGSIGLHTVPMLKTIHYTDEAVGDFFERARKEPWYPRTVFVVMSDHGLPIVPLEGPPTFHTFEELRHGVPMILVSDLLPKGVVVRGPASLADVLPTALGALGVRGIETGVGEDLLSPERDEARPVVSCDPDASVVNVASGRLTYHGTLPEATPWNPRELEHELLFDTVADPEGRRDLSAERPEELRRLREAALTYLGVYPWVVAQGMSGAPRASVTSAPPATAGTTR